MSFFIPLEEDVDHIRVCTSSKSLVGRMASQDYKFDFFVPHLGKFLSPVCFANWISSGLETARHDPSIKIKGTVKNYRDYLIYAKFWQLCKMRPIFAKENIDLPFASYRVHQSGIKESSRWTNYAPTVKAMIEHVLDTERGPHTPYPFAENVTLAVDTRIKEIAKSQGHKEESVAEESNNQTTTN